MGAGKIGDSDGPYLLEPAAPVFTRAMDSIVTAAPGLEIGNYTIPGVAILIGAFGAGYLLFRKGGRR